MTAKTLPDRVSASDAGVLANAASLGQLPETRPPPPAPPFDDGSFADDDGGMEQRLRAIEDRLLKFETKSDSFSTKDDVRAVEASVSRIETSVHRELHAQTWKLIGVIVVLFGAAMSIAKLFHP